MIKEIQIETNQNKELVDITLEIEQIIKDIKEGIVVVYTPHTTSAITINENADPDVQRDLLMKLQQISSDYNYKHSEGNSDAHLVSSIVGASETLIVKNGQLVLGTWQSIYFLEFDGPRNRKVFVYSNTTD